MYDPKSPILIHIDKLPAVRVSRPIWTNTAFGDYWVVCGAYPSDARVYPEPRAPRPYENDIRNYNLLIEHDFSGDPDRIRFVMWDEGDLREFYRDDEFDKQVEAFIEHEVRDPETGKPAKGQRYNDLCMMDTDEARIQFNHDEVIEYLNHDQNRWSFKQARLHQVDYTIFEAIERAWFAVNQFVSFSVSYAR
jgi:hypothetical protein